MNVACFDFACAEVNGSAYIVGGKGLMAIVSQASKSAIPKRMSGPSSKASVAHGGATLHVASEAKSMSWVVASASQSLRVDVYCSGDCTWLEMKKKCVMVTTHAVIGRRKNQRKLAVFDLGDYSLHEVAVPLTGSSALGFRFGILDGKLLLFSVRDEPGHHTLIYDWEAKPGAEWQTTTLKPPGLCLCTVIIEA